MPYTCRFRKQEKLCKNKEIERLFKEGKGYRAFPFKLVYLRLEKNEQDVPLRVLIAVPKKKIRKAVNRNLMKRRMREAFRQKKHLIYENLEEAGGQNCLSLALIYSSSELLPYSALEKAIDELVKYLKEL